MLLQNLPSEESMFGMLPSRVTVEVTAIAQYAQVRDAKFKQY